ncbi:MAG TPA: cupredoxin domain-containing protein [Actinomycetota bacterium]|jgi:plastocyanin
MHAGRWVATGAALLAVALLAAGCGSSSSGSSGSNSGGAASTTTAGAASATTAAAAGGASDKVTLVAKGIAWDKTALTIPAGKKVEVTVENKDSVEHNLTFAAAKANKDVEGGKTEDVSFTAPAAGTYEFHCEYHPTQMKGTVKVS